MKDRKDPRPALSLWSAPRRPERQGVTLDPAPVPESELEEFPPVLLAPGVYASPRRSFAGRTVYFAVGDSDIIDVRVPRIGETADDVIAALWLANGDAIHAAQSRAVRKALSIVPGALIS